MSIFLDTYCTPREKLCIFVCVYICNMKHITLSVQYHTVKQTSLYTEYSKEPKTSFDLLRFMMSQVLIKRPREHNFLSTRPISGLVNVLVSSNLQYFGRIPNSMKILRTIAKTGLIRSQRNLVQHVPVGMLVCSRFRCDRTDICGYIKSYFKQIWDSFEISWVKF